MAMPQKAIELNEERLALVNQIEELKVKARAIKKEMDAVIENATLVHKFGNLSEGDKESLRKLLAQDSE
jgi:uncharacterized coiled-coil DUF342 family protein